jgi:hypothetical protein
MGVCARTLENFDVSLLGAGWKNYHTGIKDPDMYFLGL